MKTIHTLKLPLYDTQQDDHTLGPFADSPVELGIIGGSGLYEIDSLENRREVRVETPYGEPSDLFIVGELAGLTCAFLPRHGRGHTFTPSEVNYRANIWAIKRMGARFILSLSAVGSLQEEVEPGHLVCPDQFIDRTYRRVNTFFGDGVVAHVSFGDPIDLGLRAILLRAAKSVATVPIHEGGAYVCIEGPSFSTRAESNLFRAAGARIVGMTNLPEARLAREAEIAYATLALSTDYDCWHAEHDEVSVASVIAVMKSNVIQARAVIEAFCPLLAEHKDDEFMAHSALGGGSAVMTAPDLIPKEARQRLGLILGEDSFK